MATIRRQGEAGFDNSVPIVGGRWYLHSNADDALWGRVLEGTVMWPSDAATDEGCGKGVALVSATISSGFPWGRPRRSAGSIEGCLDDQEWLDPAESFRLLPRIWGTLTLD